MKLRNAPKAQGIGPHRTVSAADTLRRVAPLARKAGVTRIADITGLDYIGIPTVSAIVPRSIDNISVYNGKGTTKLDARVGAIMEAIERHSALTFQPPLTIGSLADLRRQQNTLDPHTTRASLNPAFSENSVIAWVVGFDILRGEETLVPYDLASYVALIDDYVTCTATSSTNGLASGNTLEEAICHALCELVERDAWTLADIGAHWIPTAHAQRMAADVLNERPVTVDRNDLFATIDLRDAPLRSKRLLGKFHRAGFRPLITEITSDLGIPTIIATMYDEAIPDLPMAHLGVGTHPDANVALSRALTELAQSRVVDIQGVREDISDSLSTDHKYMPHTKRTSRVNLESWYHKRSAVERAFGQIRSYQHSDVLEDIQLILSRLSANHIDQVIVVDLTKPELNVPVVRVIVPGLESWTADHGKIGPRATSYWRKNVVNS